MPSGNRHLIEVICSFSFLEETTEWDSIFFGSFYELIKADGFTERQERKGVQISFSGNLNNGLEPPVPSAHSIEAQVIFKNPVKGTAILLGKNQLSFHCLSNYSTWENFISTVVRPYSERYRSLGLGNGKQQCSIVYLNRFQYSGQDDLSEYFNLITPLSKDLGNEMSTTVQRVVSNGKNLLIAKLNKATAEDVQTVNLECGSVCIDGSIMGSDDWIGQANSTHEPVRDFFNAIVTQKLITTLS